MKTCKECGVEKPLDMFYVNRNMRDGHLSRCKPCTIQRYRPGVRRRATELRAFIQAIKIERGCADCGYNAHPAALDFDHLPEFVKEHKMASLGSGASKATIAAEVAKCEVVCANCHRIRTAERRGELDLTTPDGLDPRAMNSAKVTEDDVREIRRLYAEGVKQHILAKQFGLSQTGISGIITRRRWPHVE